MLVDVVKPVAVQVNGGRVHGDEDRDVSVVLVGALDHVHGPAEVVLALAAVGTLHAAVAGVEVAAHAQVEAVSLVRAQELVLGDVDDFDVLLVADQIFQIRHDRKLAVRLLVDAWQPVQVAVAGEGVSEKENSGST